MSGAATNGAPRESGFRKWLAENRVLWMIPLATLVVLALLFLLAETSALDNTNFLPF
jgi:hypothetical protein